MIMNRDHQGGVREKLMAFLLRGRTIFCCHINGFLTVSLLSEIFTQQNSNFQGENCPNKFNFWPKLPPPPHPLAFLERFEVMESAVNMSYIKKQESPIF